MPSSADPAALDAVEREALGAEIGQPGTVGRGSQEHAVAATGPAGIDHDHRVPGSRAPHDVGVEIDGTDLDCNDLQPLRDVGVVADHDHLVARHHRQRDPELASRRDRDRRIRPHHGPSGSVQHTDGNGGVVVEQPRLDPPGLGRGPGPDHDVGEDA